MADMLTEQQNKDFHDKGYLLLSAHYDVEKQIMPIQQGIQRIIALLAEKYGVDAPCATPEEAMMRGYTALIRANRAWGGEVYDAIKQIPAFMRLVTDAGNASIFEALRPGGVAGIAGQSFGIRIDNPGEEKFRSHWHQEFPSHLRSLDGMVFWSPLLPITPELGPVQIAEGSHREGIIPVYEKDIGVGAVGAYQLYLDREEERLAQYPHVAPLSRPGDLLVMDYLTLHQSGYNMTDYPRWSMQYRYFNFTDPLGIDISWKGSFTSGVKYADVLPVLAAKAQA